ncbi:MAG: DNA polymerase III subunit epsilon [Maricaulaceae bacterium]
MSGVREIVFDTETTGFDAKGDDRITEIGCIEIIDLLPTGESFHAYLDPQRDIPERVTEITGLTREFLDGKPLFKDVARDFLNFIGDSTLIAHNADFDRGFVNASLIRAGYDPIPTPRFKDTLRMARAKFPGSPASLDALCKRFDISLTSRDKHGAIIDSELLAQVYLELNGGRARSLGLNANNTKQVETVLKSVARSRPNKLEPRLTELEKEQHEKFIADLGDDMMWNKHWSRQNQS